MVYMVEVHETREKNEEGHDKISIVSTNNNFYF